MLKVTVTYTVTTPESAEHGDYEDCGWALPGGWEHSSRDDKIMADARKNPDAYVAYIWEDPGDLQSIVDGLKREFGIGLEGVRTIAPGCFMGELCSVDSIHDCDYFEKGEERRYTAFIDGVTKSTRKRIMQLFA